MCNNIYVKSVFFWCKSTEYMYVFCYSYRDFVKNYVSNLGM